MFCKRVCCVFVLMAMLAQHYDGEGIGIREIAQTHDLSLLAFEGVVERLDDFELVVNKKR